MAPATASIMADRGGSKGVGVLLSGVGDGGGQILALLLSCCALECHQHSRAFQHSLGLISSPELRPRWPLLGVLSRFQRKEARLQTSCPSLWAMILPLQAHRSDYGPPDTS